MDILVNILVLIFLIMIWIAFAWYSGKLEAFYWHWVSYSKDFVKTEKEHNNWTLVRFLVASGLVIAGSQFYGVAALILYLIFICLFPFVHDGFYYLWRNNIDSNDYQKRFKDTSTTSTAKTPTLDYRTRLVLATFFVLFFSMILIKLSV